MKRIYALLPLIAATALDRLITIPNIAYEKNPLVLSLGASKWILLTTLLVFAYSGLVYWLLGVNDRRVRVTTYAAVVCLTVLTISAVGINLIVLV